MATVDCGSSSTLIFSNGDEDYAITVTVDGLQFAVNSYDSLLVPCNGVASVTAPSFTLVPAPLPDLHNDYAFSFLWGLLAAFAFAVASIRRWF